MQSASSPMTFMVRLTVAADGALDGIVERPKTGETERVRGGEALVAMLGQMARKAAPVAALLVLIATPAPAACVGDCDGSGQVAINELIRGVGIALGNEPPSACAAFQDAQGQVTIAQLIQGVNHALSGCPAVDGGLAGAPGTRALDAVADVFSAEAHVAAGELSGALVRTQVDLAFRKDATVGAVNGVLDRIDGRIVSSRRGVLILVVRIPDPGSAAALDLLLAELAADPVVRVAAPVLMPKPNALPEIITPGTTDVQFVRHQLAVRAHAAWNARAALATASPPTLVVADYFGDGPPDAGLFGAVDFPTDFTDGSSDEHGYHVLGIAAGAFDGVGGNRAADAVTGMFPGAIPLRVADNQRQLGSAVLDDLMLALVENVPGSVVLNTSLGFDCDTLEGAARSCTRDAAARRALQWIERVRGTDWPADLTFDLEGKFLHATAASNVPPVGRRGADVSSEWNAAALLSPLVDPVSLQLVPNLTNTLVVENFTSTPDEPFQPDCIASGSELGGTIGAIGSGVHSFTGPTTTGEKTGTSMAAPQVAGLAAYVWALRPGLSPAELVALLQRTAQAEAGCGNGLVIDAYAALLAADEGNPTRPVRSALLDVADGAGNEGRNGAFDERDLDLFLARLDAPAAGQVDYGRYDLNGDGVTGVPALPTGSKRVDLDLDGAYGLATLDVEGLPLRFDEEVGSDLKILCHSAYSDLYAGDPARDHQARRERLGLARCLDVGSEALFPSTVAPGVNNLLSVRIVDRDLADLTGSAPGQAGVRIELNVTGGTVDDFFGTTNGDGIFQTNARLFAGQPELTIEVVARAGGNGPELARTTVTATSSVSNGVTRLSSRGQAVVTINAPTNCENVRRSPDGATTWSDTLACEITQPGPGRQASGVATTSFTESFAGGDLVAVTASSTSSATGLNVGACGNGDYQLMFSVAQTAEVSIDAQVTVESAGDLQGIVFAGPDGLLIDDRDGGPVTQTLTLSPGEYTIVIQAAACVGPGIAGMAHSGSFSLNLTFGS